jgi:peroxiredoxin family protein
MTTAVAGDRLAPLEAMLDALFHQLDFVAATLREQALWACKMSVDMMKLTKEDFIDEVEDIINVSHFLELSRDGQIIFV